MKFLALLFCTLITASSWAGVSTSPEFCLTKKILPCTVLSHAKADFHFGGIQYFVAKGTLLEIGQDGVFVGKGHVWMKSKKPMAVKAKFGRVEARSGGELWFENLSEAQIVRAVEKDLHVFPRGREKPVLLTPGFEVELGGVDAGTKQARVSLPMTINMPRFIRSVSSVFPFRAMNFQEKVSELGRTVVEASEKLSAMYGPLVERKLANIRDEDLRSTEEIRRQAEHEAYLRRLYRKKSNFED